MLVLGLGSDVLAWTPLDLVVYVAIFTFKKRFFLRNQCFICHLDSNEQ